jgi:hypothetical protein
VNISGYQNRDISFFGSTLKRPTSAYRGALHRAQPRNERELESEAIEQSESVWKQNPYKRSPYVTCRARLRTDLLDNRPLAMLLEIPKILIYWTLVSGQPLNGQVTRADAFQDLVHIDRSTLRKVATANAKSKKAPVLGKFPPAAHRGESVCGRKVHDLSAVRGRGDLAALYLVRVCQCCVDRF